MLILDVLFTNKKFFMRNFKAIFTVVFFALLCVKQVNAQITISKPSLGFSQACASASFNTYYITFSFTPEASLGASNQFIIELSDSSGSFSNPTVVFTSSQGSVTSSPATLGFALPENTSGETYRVRVKSTAPYSESNLSNVFSAYYKIQDTPFTINNLIETGIYCSGGSYLLTIDNPGDQMNDSPLQYSSLTFKWFKETGPTTSVFVASGESFLVSQPGTYFVETNYGTCTSNSFSNRVTISEASSGSTTTSISSSLGNPYCSADGPTTLSAIAGSGYQWYKDGEKIEDATSQMYTTNEEGVYSVNIDLGDCVSSASINLQNTDFESSIDVPEDIVLESEDTLLVTVTTTAKNPEFKWFLNNLLIPGESANIYEVSEIGDYKVIIKQTNGCNATEEFLFKVEEPIELFPEVANIPNILTPNGDGDNDTWVIPKQYVSGTNAKVQIFTSQGKEVLNTNDYQNNWPETQIDFKAINPIYYYIITTPNNKTKSGSITVVR